MRYEKPELVEVGFALDIVLESGTSEDVDNPETRERRQDMLAGLDD